jgi:putative ABC transport system substrate-binding protein
MKNFIKLSLCGLLSFGLVALTACTPEKKSHEVTVGIVAPVAIPAMTEIVDGFKTELTKLYPHPIHFIVQNAQGDVNIQRSILQQFKTNNVNLVVPIGTATAQMANAMNAGQPIVALAAEFKTAQRDKFRNKNITNVLDEVDIDKQLAFIHSALPGLKKITLIYSPDDRIFTQVQKAAAAAKADGIQLQKLMIQNLPDLYTVSKQVDKDSQAIFILKDETVVSGINTLVKQAQQHHLLLIASDDGSVQKGADFAVGVSERLIGEGGAQLAAQVLNGTAPSQIPVKVMTQYHVYVTPAYEQGKNGLAANLSYAHVKAAATKFNYPVETLPLENN